jgi:hypothetical protein
LYYKGSVFYSIRGERAMTFRYKVNRKITDPIEAYHASGEVWGDPYYADLTLKQDL